jgi:DNA-binding SARP family transcriptional activator
MTFEIHLLGSPRVVRDGQTMPPPRGNKVWGLLAYLLLRNVPAGRTHVADLLFPQAEDPLAALRWNLTMARRLLGDPGAFTGDPLISSWSQRPVVDVLTLRSADPSRPDPRHDDPLAELDHLGQDLLASMQFAGCPSFEIWLEAERRHARGSIEAFLHEAALTRLARGDADGGADLAGRLVSMNPYDENFQVLLVRALAVGGHGVAASRQAAACRELFRSELGIEPGPALDAAVSTLTSAPTASASTGRPAVIALIEAGEAAIGAGALDAGLQCLRRAIADARVLADAALTASSFTALGSALVHAARGSDEEGVTALHRAVTFEGADSATLGLALSELAYVEFLHGRYDRVEVWLARAEAATAGSTVTASAPVKSATSGSAASGSAADLRTADSALWAVGLSVRGSTLSDLGRYPEALKALSEGLALGPDDRRRSYLLSMVGRVHLLRGDLDQAAEALVASMALAAGTGWTAFTPWPESLLAEVDLHRGELASAQTKLEHAFALGCQIGDPCWEGLAARGLGLVRIARGDIGGGVETLLDARRRASRLPDAYVWVQAYVLDALAAVGVAHRLPEARHWVADLAAVADRSGMAELAVRAAVHRWRLGDPAGQVAARALGAAIDNPVLTALLD